MESERDFLLQSLRSNLLVISLGVGGLIFFAYGLYQISLSKSDDPIVIETSSSQPLRLSEASAEKEIVVDVEGAVMRPGVYTLSQNARVQDALIQAGGMRSNADRQAVAKSLNMASKLTDGAKIYIPFEGESDIPFHQGVTAQGSPTGNNDSLISLNSASESELDALPGVGPATVAKIITHRPYSHLEELISKKVITKSTFEKIKDKISL